MIVLLIKFWDWCTDVTRQFN